MALTSRICAIAHSRRDTSLRPKPPAHGADHPVDRGRGSVITGTRWMKNVPTSAASRTSIKAMATPTKPARACSAPPRGAPAANALNNATPHPPEHLARKHRAQAADTPRHRADQREAFSDARQQPTRDDEAERQRRPVQELGGREVHAAGAAGHQQAGDHGDVRAARVGNFPARSRAKTEDGN